MQGVPVAVEEKWVHRCRLAIFPIAMMVASVACGDDPKIECDFPNESRCNEEANSRELCVSVNDSMDKTLVTYVCRVGTRCYVTSPGATACLTMPPN